jgi:hypothetical protein
MMLESSSEVPPLGNAESNSLHFFNDGFPTSGRMSKTDIDPMTRRWLIAACALLASCAVAMFALRALNDRLWSDELLTTLLLGARDLPTLWAGIALGVDGNPPLYLTGAWLIKAALPQAVSFAATLKLVNLALTGVAVVALCRVGRRILSSEACWIGALLFVTLNDNVARIAFELRTYALYFLMATLAVLVQQRLIEQQHRRHVVELAIVYVGLTLAHTFGIVYVACIALAGVLSQLRGERSAVRLTAIATAPSILVLAAWSPFLHEQLELVKPYGWMERPGLSELLETLFASKTSMWVAVLELLCLASVAISGLKNGFDLRAAIHAPQFQPWRYVILVLAGITGVTLAGWVAARVALPLFVPRYFTPQLIVSLAVHVAFGEWLVQHARRRRNAVLLMSATVALLALQNVAQLSRQSPYGGVVCADGDGNYLESPFVSGGLPVIAESPHVFLPRTAYADHGSAYRFPLDWEVVLKYPENPRGNAVDFHIMQNLQRWAPMPSVMSTEDIVQSYPNFLVIEQSGRAWFRNLKATRNVVAEKLAETPATNDIPSHCTIWKVTNVSAPLKR